MTKLTVSPGVFFRYGPTAPAVPLIVDVSRSGREYPTTFRSPASFTDVHDNVSMYVDELWADAPAVGASLLYACFPNTFIDVNRAETDIDPSLLDGPWPAALQPTHYSERGLGLIKRNTRFGKPMHEGKLAVNEIAERVERYYKPYHAELASMMEEARRQFGRVWHLSCHCMSAVGAPTHPDKGKPRVDVCLGNQDGKTSSNEFIEMVRAEFERRGYRVGINDPYRGAELNSRHGKPAAGCESILVELNKKLFMDVDTFRKSTGFDGLRSDLRSVLQTLADRLAQT
ncbi:MAG: N-formylglutamate amidohydrolase [Burkholderiaceae bacterium]